MKRIVGKRYKSLVFNTLKSCFFIHFYLSLDLFLPVLCNSSNTSGGIFEQPPICSLVLCNSNIPGWLSAPLILLVLFHHAYALHSRLPARFAPFAVDIRLLSADFLREFLHFGQPCGNQFQSLVTLFPALKLRCRRADTISPYCLSLRFAQLIEP